MSRFGLKLREENMPEFMILMNGDGGSAEQWSAYIDSLQSSGAFRGGSALGNVQRIGANSDEVCTVTGFMRFEVESMEDVINLMDDNPVRLAGGSVDVLELIKT